MRVNMPRHASFSFLPRLSKSSQYSICIRCQHRLFASLFRLQSPEPPSKPLPAPPKPLKYRKPSSKENSAPLDDVLKSESDNHTPQPLGRPIGMRFPPSPEENCGTDNHSVNQRDRGMSTKEKIHDRRRQLKHEMFEKPYFRDWSNLKWNQGKTFVANPRLFRQDKALWFPNFVGQTLVPGSSATENTTPVLSGKVSVVCIYSSEWAHAQVESFQGKANPEIGRVLRENEDAAQRLDISVEESTAKYWILRPFFYRLRGQRKEKDYGRYFVVRKGIPEEIKEAIGVINSKVGYVYLVDGDGKIRWAGSGPSRPEERETMTKGLRKLLEEAKMPKDNGSEKGAKLDEVDAKASS